ncbi:hypothetical protein H310_09409 [Aphanomyces invadans]|uniref:Ndc10 domain-containing protein n=1 Tax=Aphanomyces invadans TaxID=157072 RepID=A0A024TU29_9STRA|nr:hypothetical protein H310_09409 [Aphanomyces invadans]ETV97484.1 hypothetical protein H310_09409 [Aphanomyces invadans]|eukprot:XP_008873693.1 hypothetical protein H310_09409 [Aphanomyces invadans]
MRHNGFHTLSVWAQSHVPQCNIQSSTKPSRDNTNYWENNRQNTSWKEDTPHTGESVDKLCHWATRSRNGANANHVVPWDCVKVLAGFGPESKGYYLPRGLLKPHEDLLRQVFPKLEESQSMIQTGHQKIEIAAKGFVYLLTCMRAIVLQDAALLLSMETYQNHPLFTHSVFQDPMFHDIKAWLLSTINTIPHWRHCLCIKHCHS